MIMTNKILRARRNVPFFPRVDAHKKIKLKRSGWRKAKGRHTRRKKLSPYHGAVPSIGYGTPAATRNLHSSGLAVTNIFNLNDLEKVDAQKSGIKIMNVGMKKKLGIIKESLKRKIRIFNLRKPEEFIKEHERVVKEPAAKSGPEKKEHEVSKK
jgi:large subunit ribosomal protein L32e